MARSHPWWALLLPLSLGLAVGLWSLTRCSGTPHDERLPLDQLAASTGFTLEPLLVPATTLVASGMPRDGLPILDHPVFVPPAAVAELNAAQRGKFLVSADRVIGVQIGGEARAYPLRLLRWHEVVNDTVGGLPIAVTYSPLCDAVTVVERRLGGEKLELGVSGLLSNSNPLLYDRRSELQTASLWLQISGHAVAGPAAARGARLRLLPCELATWESWRNRHPGGTVLKADPRFATMYKRDPYHSYHGSEILRYPVAPLPEPNQGLELKDRVVAVELGDEQLVLSLKRLAAAWGRDTGRWQGMLGGHSLSVEFSRDQGTAVVTVAGAEAENLGVRYAYWFAWHATYSAAPEPGPLI